MDGGELRFYLGEEGNFDFVNSLRDKEILKKVFLLSFCWCGI